MRVHDLPQIRIANSRDNPDDVIWNGMLNMPLVVLMNGNRSQRGSKCLLDSRPAVVLSQSEHALRVLAQGKALTEAQKNRASVSAVRDRQATLDDPFSEAGFQDWADWAVSQVDRIDPVLYGSFQDPFNWTIERPTALILEGGR